MKNLSSNDLELVTLDGETFFILSDSQFMDILNGATLDDIVVEHVSIVENDWDIIKDKEGMKLAIRKGPMTMGKWWFLLLYFVEGKCRRISLMPQECSSCKWNVYIATPLASDLYFTLKEDVTRSVYDECKQLPVVGCPNCGTKFKIHAIWAGRRGE